MKDNFGRPLTGLRISVTQRCNLNCFYCHREGCKCEGQELPLDSIERAVQVAKEFGIKKIKITGGEPLIRKDIVDIVRVVAQDGLKDVSLTTNGTLLSELARDLADAGLKRINVSLDTLRQDRYQKITGAQMLSRVIEGVDAAVAAGLHPVKLNMVLLRGVNEDEVESMIEFTKSRKMVLQLIELLWTPHTDAVYQKFHLDLLSIEKELQKRSERTDVRKEMQARRKYFIDGAEVEVVRPMHNSQFCAHCTRIRLTPGGYLKPCLLRSDNLVDISMPLRSGNIEEVKSLFLKAVSLREPFFK